MPTLHCPPSITVISGKQFYVDSAVVALIHPNLFAEGAARGTFASLITSLTIALSGNLMPTVGPLAVQISGTHYFLGRTMVSGPGQ